MAASAMVGQMLMLNYDQPPVVGIIAIILFSCFVGFANGFLIQKVKVDSFIVTMGMLLIMEGIALVIAPRPLGPSPSIFIKVFNGKLFNLLLKNSIGLKAMKFIIVFCLLQRNTHVMLYFQD